MVSDLILLSAGPTGAAAVAGALVAAAALLAPRRGRDPVRQALVAGVAYAALALVTWGVPRALAGAFADLSSLHLVSIALFAPLSAAVLGLLAALPVYLRASRGMVAPALALGLPTAAVAHVFLTVSGEIGTVALFSLGLGPIGIGALGVGGLLCAAGLELGVERVRTAPA